MARISPTTDLSVLQRTFVQFARRSRAGDPVTLNTVQVPKIKAQVAVAPTRAELVRATLDIRSQVDPRGQNIDLTA